MSFSTAEGKGSETERETASGKIQRVSEINRTINVFEYGAIADGESHKLNTLFKSQNDIDEKYGTGKYTLEDEADFVAIREALAAAKSKPNQQLPEGDFGLWTIHMPTGIYIINGTIDLRHTYGVTIRGNGHTVTRIRFEYPSTLFYIEEAGHIWFREFGIESTPSALSTAFHFQNIIGSGFPTFKFHFDNVGFRGFYRVILTTGDTMCSEMVFLKCRFANCLTGLHLKNVQSMNFNFFGCDFESSEGDPFYTPYKASDTAFIKAEAGGCVNVYGGSILLHGTTLLLDPNFEISEDPINMITGMYNFYGVTWEQWSAGRPLLFEKNGNGSMRARVNFDNCRVHQLMAAREAKADLGALHNGMNVSIRNSNFTYGRIQLNVDENTTDQWGSLTIDNSQFVDYYERRSEEVKNLPNVNHHVRYINAAIRPIDHAAFSGKSKIDQMDFDILPDATVSAKAKRIYYTEPTGTLTGKNGQILIRIPKHGVLTKIGVVKTSSESTEYSISDSSGVIEFGQIDTNAETHKGFIRDIELLNDGVQWDGSIRIEIKGEKKRSAGRIFFEYY